MSRQIHANSAVCHQQGEGASTAQNVPNFFTYVNDFLRIYTYVQRNMMGNTTVYMLLITKNHSTLSLSIVETVNCQFLLFAIYQYMLTIVLDVQAVCTSFRHFS